MNKLLIIGLLLMVGCTATPVEVETAAIKTPPPEEEVSIGVHPDDSCGHAIGDAICNLALKDQNDETWQLHDLKGSVVVLDFSAMWCGPCQSAAATVQATKEHYESQGFEYVTVLVDDPAGNPVDLEDVQSWAHTFEITSAPVLQGNRGLIDYTAEAGYPIKSWPTFVFVDRDMKVHQGIYGFSEEAIREIIEEIL